MLMQLRIHNTSMSCISSQNVFSPTQHDISRLIIRLKHNHIQTEDITTTSTDENVPKTLNKVIFITEKNVNWKIRKF